jgi:ribosomal protein S3
MGQKVHPLGFRVGITKKHQSQWFAKFQKYGYSQSVFEDHMLRKTLVNLFSNLEKENQKNLTKQSKKPGANAAKMPKITQIKIERGLIPYEIGIQIHSDDCLAITKAIDNIKISKDLVSNLQKTRKYLFKAGTQLKNTQNKLPVLEENLTTNKLNKTLNLGVIKLNGASFFTGNNILKSTKKRKFKIKSEKKVKGKSTKSFFKARRKQKKKLSKTVFMLLKNIKKRFKKRQSIKKRYLNIIAKGLLIRKKGNLIIRNVKIKPKNLFKLSGNNTSATRSNLNVGLKAKYNNSKTNLKIESPKVTTSNTLSPSYKLNRASLSKPGSSNTSFTGVDSKMQILISNRMYKKFASLFLTKLNKQFLARLKTIMKLWHNQKTTQAPLGYNKKWYSAKSALSKITNLKAKSLSKNLGNYQVEKLTKLIAILEKKSLVKMETLRKDFITFGTLSKTRAFGYYQMITFLKQLKELVTKIKKQISLSKNNNKLQIIITDNKLNSNKTKIQNLIRAKSKQKKTSLNLNLTLVNNFVNLVNNNQAMANESRKIKWITYLKDLVNKHRTENIFYYLATIADARKDLKALKRYTKQHSNFLFGVNCDKEFNKENPNALLQRVTKTLTQSSKNATLNLNNTNYADVSSEGLTRLQKAFLTQIESQRKMYKANLALTPKISIKFFSVKTTDILEKASIVADSIIDALEKRKAFRGVIKKAKEDLMRRPRVKGVKIQVAGRLNGAEIARSEWVRAGRVPLQTLRANIDYSYRTANTIYGIIGVKVWIFKGYSKI